MNCFDMKRRDFITLLAATAAMAAPRRLRAQPQRVATIGVLVTGNASPDEFLTGLREALREVGLIEGQNVRLEVRTAGGRAADCPVRPGLGWRQSIPWPIESSPSRRDSS